MYMYMYMYVYTFPLFYILQGHFSFCIYLFLCLFVNVKLSMRRSPAAMTQEVVEVGLVQGRGRQREGSQEPAEVEPLNHPFSFLSGHFPDTFRITICMCLICSPGLSPLPAWTAPRT